MSEWKSVIEADLKDAEYTPRAPLPDGEYSAFVSNIEAKIFASNSKGIQVTYVITDGEHKDRDIRDYFVIVKTDGSINKSGPALTKKLMLECGVDPKDILKFKYPEFGTKAFGDFNKLLGKNLTLTVKSQVQKKGQNVGKTFARVQSFKMAA